MLTAITHSDVVQLLFSFVSFSWCLHSTVVILAELVMPWFMQQDSKAGVHQNLSLTSLPKVQKYSF
jgi:hypothetical protein